MAEAPLDAPHKLRLLLSPMHAVPATCRIAPLPQGRSTAAHAQAALITGTGTTTPRVVRTGVSS